MLETLLESSDCNPSLISEEVQKDLNPWDDIIIVTSSSSSQGGEGGARPWSTPFMEKCRSSWASISEFVVGEFTNEVVVVIELWAIGRFAHKSAKWLLESNGSEQLRSTVSIAVFILFVFLDKCLWIVSVGCWADPILGLLANDGLVVFFKSEKIKYGN